MDQSLLMALSLGLLGVLILLSAMKENILNAKPSPNKMSMLYHIGTVIDSMLTGSHATPGEQNDVVPSYSF